LAGSKFFKVFCGANTSSRPYTITQTGTALTRVGGAETIPNNAWTFTPIPFVDTTDVDDIADEPLPAGAAVGPRVSANSAGASWIDTGANTNIVVSQAAYAIVGDPALAVDPLGPLTPPSQAAGTYTAEVTWTLTAL
jgi:hypothetical protein